MGFTEEEWEATRGPACPVCGKDTYRFIDGMCKYCHLDKEDEREKKLETKKMRAYYQRKLHNGTISLAAMRAGRL